MADTNQNQSPENPYGLTIEHLVILEGAVSWEKVRRADMRDGLSNTDYRMSDVQAFVVRYCRQLGLDLTDEQLYRVAIEVNQKAAQNVDGLVDAIQEYVRLREREYIKELRKVHDQLESIRRAIGMGTSYGWRQSLDARVEILESKVR